MLNISRLHVVKISTLNTLLIFIPVIAYAPFFFTEWFNPIIRIGYFFVISLFLFASNRKFFKKDLILLFLFLFLFLNLLSGTTNLSSLISAGNYCLTLFFGWALMRYMQSSTGRSESVLNFYVKFFFIVPIFSFLSLIYLLTLGELDLFGFKSEIAAHQVTPFGVHFKRIFADLTVYRSFFYFVEGAHASIFYAANIIIVAPLIKNNSLNFIKINLFGGFLTFSMTFYVVLLVLYGYTKLKSFSSIFGIAIASFLLLFLFQAINILSYSSSEDRLERLLIFFLLMDSASISQLLLGHGVGISTGFSKAFTGLLLSLYESGIIGTILQLYILYLLAPTRIIFLFFLLSALVVDPIRYPLFIFLIVVAGHFYPNQKEQLL